MPGTAFALVKRDVLPRAWGSDSYAHIMGVTGRTAPASELIQTGYLLSTLPTMA
jgi:hypothetical protein